MGLSHLGDLMLCQKLHKTCNARVSVLLWWSCWSPVAYSHGLLNHHSSFCGGMFKLNAKSDAGSLLYLFSHFGCDSHTVPLLTQWCVYCPHWLIQWSHHCSCMRITVHSPWLLGYIDVTENVLIMLTVVGLFLDRPRVLLYFYLAIVQIMSYFIAKRKKYMVHSIIMSYI